MRFKSSPRRNKHYLPELVASGDASRPVLTKVHLNVDTSAVEVTDSYMLARFPVELDEGDTAGPIPVDALKASRKPPLKGQSSRIHLNGNAEVVMDGQGGVDSAPYLTVPRESADYQWPNFNQLIPDEANMAEFEIGLNAAALYKLAKAMGDDVVRLRFVATPATDDTPAKPNPLRPILVDPGNGVIGGDAPRGLLMPVRIIA